MKKNSKQDSRMKKDNRIMKWFHSSSSKCFFMILAAFICLFALLVMICTPRRYDLAVGVVSHDTINATKDVIDEVTTQEKRTAAAAASAASDCIFACGAFTGSRRTA